jgi:hypothetical protein
MTHRMVLCAALQSGGSTIVSWCFLQRADTDGVLDMPNDNLRTTFERASRPVLWCKTTVGSFRWLDAAELYADLGHEVEPLLIVRDARAAMASLVEKDYGFNGTTAEQPPLRMRFRRFLRDWELFRQNGWPILSYEQFVAAPAATLRQVCSELRLPWDEAMLSWPKPMDAIAYVGEGLNRSFERTVSAGSLEAALLRTGAPVRLPESELAWLEETFAAYNEANGYPPHLEGAAIPVAYRQPSYRGSARQWYIDELERLREQLRRKSRIA